jgi:rhamnosyltransferase
MTMQCRNASGSVIVFFHPDEACIERANRLAESTFCVVVDNTPGANSVPGLSPSVRYLPAGENLGVATALNRGIAELVCEGCRTGLLFDQDSDPSVELIRELPSILTRMVGRGERVAVVAPAYNDVRLGGVAPFVRFKPFKLERVPATGQNVVDVDFLITSGSCINLACWPDVGTMDDSLFIDLVDLEWCVKAKRAGYRVLGVPWIKMNHELGGEPIRVFGRSYPMHSPLRHYYLFRNVTALVLRSYVPWTWKSTEIVKLPVRLLIYSLMPSERMAHLTMALRGIFDGLRGRLGAYKQQY